MATIETIIKEHKDFIIEGFFGLTGQTGMSATEFANHTWDWYKRSCEAEFKKTLFTKEQVIEAAKLEFKTWPTA
jgi:hypothetical protein